MNIQQRKYFWLVKQPPGKTSSYSGPECSYHLATNWGLHPVNGHFLSTKWPRKQKVVMAMTSEKPATRACPAVWRLKCLNNWMPLPKQAVSVSVNCELSKKQWQFLSPKFLECLLGYLYKHNIFWAENQKRWNQAWWFFIQGNLRGPPPMPLPPPRNKALIRPY